MIAIVAYDKAFAIAKNGKIPWRLQTDTAWYRQQIAGKTVVMGGKTASGINNLDGCRCIVLTRDPKQTFSFPATICATKEEVLKLVDDTTILIGGGQIYQLFWPEIDEVLASEVDAVVDGDVFFPKDHISWPSTVLREVPQSDHDEKAFKIVRYTRPNKR